MTTTSIKHALLAAAGAVGVLAGAASAQETPRYEFVHPGDTALCLQLGAGSDACARVRWTFYTWPNIIKELGRALNPEPTPWKGEPEPDPWMEVGFAGLGLDGYPNPEDDDGGWGPLGPWVHEGIRAASAVQTGAPVVKANDYYNKQIFSAAHTVEDLHALRSALDEVGANLDEAIAKMEAGK